MGDTSNTVGRRMPMQTSARLWPRILRTGNVTITKELRGRDGGTRSAPRGCARARGHRARRARRALRRPASSLVQQWLAAGGRGRPQLNLGVATSSALGAAIRAQIALMAVIDFVKLLGERTSGHVQRGSCASTMRRRSSSRAEVVPALQVAARLPHVSTPRDFAEPSDRARATKAA
jgi:hypothetical protein